MSIIPDKKNGKLTGRYRVEVYRGGKRLRGRTDDLVSAKRLEVSFLSQFDTGVFLETVKPSPVAPVVPTTLKHAKRKASGLLWAGQATEMESFRKVDRLIRILGEGFSLDSFDSNAVDRIVKDLQASGAKDGTINRYLSCISAFLNFCHKRGWMLSPVPEVDWRDEDEGRVRWISYDEESSLLRLLPEPYSTLVYIAIRTGLRASELLSLKPEQVEAGWIRLWQTKNGKIRSVPVTPDLGETLATLVSGGRIPVEYWQLRIEWDKARKAMGLDKDATFTFHACRHTYATRAVQAGVNIRVIQKLMGHSAIQTTLRYAHVDDQTLSAEATKSIVYHAAKVGEKGGGITPRSVSRGAPRTAETRHGVSPYRPANPCTPVRFRLGPPDFLPIISNDE
jgi:integrase